MNDWLIAALILSVGLVPCGIVCFRSSVLDSVVGLQLAGGVTASMILLLSVGSGRSPYADVALLLAILSFAGGLVFVRFLERRG